MISPDVAPPADAANTTIHDPRRRRAILVAVCIALMAVIASVSGLNVAQQEIALAFNASQGTVLWIIGVWTGVAGGGGILGMYLSAILVDLASWRWLFVLPVALVAVAIVMALRSIPNSREESRHGFDTVGSLASVVAAVGLIFVLHEGPERGWTALVTLLSLLVGVLGAVGFVAWELRQQAPLLDVRLFRKRGLANGCPACSPWDLAWA